ncbi:MAG TPA: tRNA uracil 4-sulfurtransferase ThiI [Nitrospiria bacterium]|nr:tRNA uracil 4-sulfurtransferase ThiI [Nitrospiria bacterium]
MKKPTPDCAVLHYHEIALKGGNRPMFLRRLTANIDKATRDLGKISIIKPRGRILLKFKDTVSWELLRRRLSTAFGTANFSPAFRTGTDPDGIGKNVDRLIEGKQARTFRIAARRGNKNYPLTSMELNIRLGKQVEEKTGWKVDLDHADLTIHVEVLDREALIYFEKIPGPGGLPVGVSGHVVSLLSGGFDSPVASYLMMKRGCTMSFVHFHSYPHLTKASLEKAEDLADHLTRHQFSTRLHAVAFGDIQRQIVLEVPPPLRVVLYRRFMIRISQEIARQEKARALITGENLGQVASQTLENISAIQNAGELPILRPLIGFDKEEIIDLAREIGTYSVSVQPDQDCCRLFIPPHPSVAARLPDVEKAERKLDIDRLVKEGLDSVEKTEYRFP